jgi:hypothetical protein
MGLILGMIKFFICGLPNWGDLAIERQRLALDILNIILWLDGEDVEVTGVMESEKQALQSNIFCYF